MDLNTAKLVIGDSSMSDDEVSVLLLKAKRLAQNQYFWHPEDQPTDDELDAFYERYEFEICSIAREIKSSDARGGLTAFSELGVSRTWGKTGTESISSALAAIPCKSYVI